MSDKKFTPDWTNTPPVPGSYRSIVKEGRQDQVKVPSWQYYEQIKRDLKLDDNYFTNKQDGNQLLNDIPKSNLDTKIIEEIISIVGAENVQCDDYNRVKYSYGKLAEEMVALKRGSCTRLRVRRFIRVTSTMCRRSSNCATRRKSPSMFMAAAHPVTWASSLKKKA